MSSLVQDDLTRATTFFALAFGLTALGGLAIGDLRLGVEYGLALGVGFAVFAYFFVAPTALDDDGDPDSDPDDEATSAGDDAPNEDTNSDRESDQQPDDADPL